MAGITQSELEMTYFQFGVIRKGKYQKKSKDFTIRNIKNKQK